jgi:polyisoprenoid-binding protein YceI
VSRTLPLVLLLGLALAGCAGAALAPEATTAPAQPSAPEATATLPPPEPASDPTVTPFASLPEGALRLVLAAEGNQAQFAVREQLAGLDLPNDAVGTTAAVGGTLVIRPDGQLVAGESRFVVDLATLKTDSSRRDGYIQRNTLETGIYPEAIFVPTAAAGLPAALPASGPVAFQLTGDLTVHGVTRPATWDVTGQVAGQTFSGTATTSITFTDFGMTLPRVGPVLSVDDLIRLQLDFTLIAQ